MRARTPRDRRIWRGALGVVALLLAGPGDGAACETVPRADGRPPAIALKPVASDEAVLGDGFGMGVHPLLGDRRLHAGIDWIAAMATPVVAAAAGRVVSAERAADYGNLVVIDHGGGWQTRYAHLQVFTVATGDCVAAGDAIGRLGQTGLVAGPQLHFEVRHHGRPLDPAAIAVP